MSGRLWIRVALASAIPPREGRAVRLADRDIALFNLGDRFLAVDNRCPHKGGPLADGIVAGDTVVCPLHAWKVCLESGGVVRPAGESACVNSYDTRIDDDLVLVEVPVDAR
jgi:nitrite reductase (NADH) small subunit